MALRAIGDDDAGLVDGPGRSLIALSCRAGVAVVLASAACRFNSLDQTTARHKRDLSRENEMSRFDNQIAVVTGGAQGIGFAVAQRLLAEGAAVWLWDMNADALAEAKSASSKGTAGGAVETAVVEITDVDNVEAAAARTAAASGRIDILVHSAGISGPTMPLAEFPAAEWKRIVDIDLYGAFTVNQAVVRRMIGQATAASSTSPRWPARRAIPMPRPIAPPRRA